MLDLMALLTSLMELEINDIDPPNPDLAMPYNTIAGTTVKKNNKFISIYLMNLIILNPMDLSVFVALSLYLFFL